MPIIEQSNVHFAGCPSAPSAAPTTCRAAATLHNRGHAGKASLVFFYSLQASGNNQQSTCTPDIPSIPAGGTVDITCPITVPAGALAVDLVLSGH